MLLFKPPASAPPPSADESQTQTHTQLSSSQVALTSSESEPDPTQVNTERMRSYNARGNTVDGTSGGFGGSGHNDSSDGERLRMRPS